MNDHAQSHEEHASKHHHAPAEFLRPQQPADLTPTLKILLTGQTLSADQTALVFEAMMTGQCHHSEMGALLALLATRTPTSDEILGAARIMRKHVDRLECQSDPDQMVDTAGTGGAPKTFNVSTAGAIVAAAAGVKVAKHGNRSRTGRGSAEVLLELGVNVDAPREVQATCLDEANVCFCFAIHHHPATKHIMPVRQALGFPTIFNLLGPLTNPAGARRQVMGVYEARFLEPIAQALASLGAIRAMVVHSEDGLDEISISAPTSIMHVEDGEIREETISPQQFGMTLSPRASVMAKDLPHAAQMIRDILEGRETGPARDMTLLNAAAAILVGDGAPTLAEAIELAKKAIDEGSALQTLESLATLSQG
ncbi:MAG: anthranilate phosphoribosyltransferase [Planctomycetota bacterium]|nr:anthranilate phosphoribosyltransferase [Planctomycetota bacterium]